MNWRIIGFYLAPPILALAVFSSTHFKTDLSAFIIAGDNAEEILLASEMQSGTLSRRYLISVDSEQQHSVPEAFTQKLKTQLKTIDGVTDVWTPDQDTNIQETLRNLYGPYAGAWYSLDPKRDLPQLFSEQSLMQRAKLLKDALLSPQGNMVKKMLVQDPLLLAINGFQTQGEKMQRTQIEDRTFSHLILETAATGLDVTQQKRIQTAIRAAFDALNNINNLSAEHYRLEMTGVPVFAVATQTLIQGDIQLVSLLSAIGLLLLFFLVFRSYSALFQVFSILLIAIMAAMLTTQLVFGYVHGMTVAIGTTLVGICIDYPIHAIAHGQAVKGQQRLSVIAKIWPSMVLGGITTLVGYLALAASGYPGLKQVAVYAASGIIISLLLTRFVLPSLLCNQSSRPLNVPLVATWTKLCHRFRLELLGVLAILLLTSLFGLTSLHWMEDLQVLTPELNYLKQIDKRIRERITTIEPGRFVMVSANNIDAALEKSEAVYKVLDRLKQSEDLVEYYGLYPWLLSKQKQELNQTLLQHYLSPENLERWQNALTQQGLSVEKLGHFNYPKTSSLSLDQVLATPVKKMIDSRIVHRDNQILLMVWLAEHRPEAVRAALVNMEGVQYFSQRDLFNTMTLDYLGRAQQLLFAGLVVILLLLLMRYQDLIKALQALSPAVLSAVIMLGCWSYASVAISFLHLVGFLLVVAICVDYGIFYQENRGGDITLTYQSMGAAMLTSALTFACLMVSESTALKILSGVVVTGVVLGFLLCPILIKPNYSPVA